MKVPKQLNYWFKKLGFRPERRGSLYFKSKNRHARVLVKEDSLIVEISFTNKDWDRWANSVQVRFEITRDQAFEDMFRFKFFKAMYVQR